MSFLNELITEDIHKLIDTEFADGLLNLDNLFFKNEMQINKETTYNQLKLRKIKSNFYSKFVPYIYMEDFSDHQQMNVNFADTINKIITYLRTYNANVPYENDYYLTSTSVTDINKLNITIKDNKILIIYTEEGDLVNTFVPASQYVTIEYIENDLDFVYRAYEVVKSIREFKYFTSTYEEFKRMSLDDISASYSDEYAKYEQLFIDQKVEFIAVSDASHSKYLKINIEGTDEINYLGYAILLNNNIPESTDPFDIVKIGDFNYIKKDSFKSPGTALGESFEYFDGENTTTLSIDTITDTNSLETDIDNKIDLLFTSVSNTYVETSKVFNYNAAMDSKDMIDMGLYATEFNITDNKLSYDDIIKQLKIYCTKEQELIN